MASITGQCDPAAPLSGGYYQYRTSKAALNMAMVAMARDLRDRDVTVVIFSPGWVRTRMGGPQAPTSPEESVTGMRGIIDQLTIEYSGAWYNYDGNPIPW
jgi:NAD(P)-dependent dehydrogenase (short-subunit alcohol dehydrogenase family)